MHSPNQSCWSWAIPVNYSPWDLHMSTTKPTEPLSGPLWDFSRFLNCLQDPQFCPRPPKPTFPCSFCLQCCSLVTVSLLSKEYTVEAAINFELHIFKGAGRLCPRSELQLVPYYFFVTWGCKYPSPLSSYNFHRTFEYLLSYSFPCFVQFCRVA